jgi:hypothetical protein
MSVKMTTSRTGSSGSVVGISVVLSSSSMMLMRSSRSASAILAPVRCALGCVASEERHAGNFGRQLSEINV